jgi:hypothetical protein
MEVNASFKIREGDSIILDERGEKMSFMKVKASG